MDLSVGSGLVRGCVSVVCGCESDQNCVLLSMTYSKHLYPGYSKGRSQSGYSTCYVLRKNNIGMTTLTHVYASFQTSTMAEEHFTVCLTLFKMC